MLNCGGDFGQTAELVESVEASVEMVVKVLSCGRDCCKTVELVKWVEESVAMVV